MRLRTVASATNWPRIAPRGAPMALRMPISRVRSVTVTSMMLVMPIPPTSRLIAATAPSRTVNVRLDSLTADWTLAWLDTVKSVVPWRCPRIPVISAWAVSTASLSCAWTMIWSRPPYPVRVSWTAGRVRRRCCPGRRTTTRTTRRLQDAAIVNRIPPTSIFLPSGSARPNRSDATVLPITTVLRAAVTSP